MTVYATVVSSAIARGSSQCWNWNVRMASAFLTGARAIDPAEFRRNSTSLLLFGRVPVSGHASQMCSTRRMLTPLAPAVLQPWPALNCWSNACAPHSLAASKKGAECRAAAVSAEQAPMCAWRCWHHSSSACAVRCRCPGHATLGQICVLDHACRQTSSGVWPA